MAGFCANDESHGVSLRMALERGQRSNLQSLLDPSAGVVWFAVLNKCTSSAEEMLKCLHKRA